MTTPQAVAAEAPYRIHRYPSALIDRLHLADGRAVTVRPVLPQDADAEQAFTMALSPASRRLRFHGAVKLLPDWLLHEMTAIDYRRQVALVAETVCDNGDETRLVADARYVLVADAPGSAEFALAVAENWRGIGLGRAMLERLARHAWRQGLRRLEGTVLADNAPMLALLASLGATVRGDRHDASIVHATMTR